MELAVPSIPLAFEVTFSASGLPVAMSVYDVTDINAPILVQGPTAMVNTVGATYTGAFTGANAKNYLIFKAVYTDGTFDVLDPAYSQGTETIVVSDPGGGGGSSSSAGCQLVGIIQSTPTLIGLIEC